MVNRDKKMSLSIYDLRVTIYDLYMIECVPNFSEGRKAETIEAIRRAIETVTAARVLDVHLDADHNRSVVTFVAPREQIVEAATRAVRAAVERIDLRQHRGVHPRVGACDVLPFVPLEGETLETCVALAHEAGARIWSELGVPVYFYEAAARRPDRKNLADVRRGGFEILRQEVLTDEARKPDIGAAHLHESAGACVVGARRFLIAFNVNLKTDDIKIAKQIARRIRERDGGLPFLKALGLFLAARGAAQVSMNLTNFEVTGLVDAFNAVRREAEKLDVEIAGSEIVGLVPQAAMPKDAARVLMLENFSTDIILENRIKERLAADTRG
jgi:glutamate formiminotransferase